MHRAFAAWLIERPWRAAFASAVCGLLSLQLVSPFPVLAGAIPVLLLLRFNATAALSASMISGSVAAWVVLSAIEPTFWAMVLLVVVGCLLAVPPLLAAVLKRTASMNFSFQLAVLGAALAVGAVHVLLPDPLNIWVSGITPIVASMGISLDGEQMAQLAGTMWGVLAGMTLALVLCAFFLGRWWHSLLRAPGTFGPEYREIKFGLVLGLGVSALFVLSLIVQSALISSLLWVGLVGLAFQGLAAAHRSKAQGSLNRGWLAAIYVLLIVPISTWITVFVLAFWGFVDNWLRPRAQRT